VNVLVLDETLELSGPVRGLASLYGWEPHFIGSVHELELAVRAHGRPALVVVNLQAPLTAWELGQRLRGLEGDSPVVVLRAAGSGEAAPSVPGVQWLERPTEEGELTATLGRVVSRLGLGGGGRGGGGGVAAHGLIGQSPQLGEVLAKIEKVAVGDANVCISGESGTGKELIARAIHAQSARAERPLVTLDCTAIPEGLMESHLFGHVRGSFTGAVEHRTGFFALAHTGTLFIDEISELSLPLQAKLLRVIQTREFVKVGGSKPTRTDIRLITASNKDLRRAVREGQFREDLYYRIAVVMIEVPPLRARRGDIGLLVEHFVRKFAGAHHKRVPRLTGRATELLLGAEWPGNVRQLENCIEQAVVLSENDTIDVDVLPLAETGRRGSDAAKPGLPAGLTLRDLEQQYILQTLDSVGGNRTQAARLLGISLRCLQYKLKAYRHAEALTCPDGSAVGASRITPPGASRRAVSSLKDVLSLGDRRRMLMS
jgi:two-component system, NtrC family, response regulator HydG